MKIRTKLLLENGAIIAALAIISLLSYFELKQIDKQVKQVKDEYAVYTAIAKQMQLDVVQVQQWLSDISATRAAEGFDDGFDEAGKCYDSFFIGVNKFEELFVKNSNREGIEKIKQLKNSMEGYYRAGKQMANGYIEGGPVVGNKMMGGFDDAAVQLQEELQPFVAHQTQKLNLSLTNVAGIVSFNISLLIIVCSLSVVGALVLCVLLIKSIVNSINMVVEFSDKMALGDMSARLPVKNKKTELGEMSFALNQVANSLEEKAIMAKEIAGGDLAKKVQLASEKDTLGIALASMSNNLRDIIGNIQSSTSLVSSEATHINDASQALSQGATEAAASIRSLAGRSAKAARETAELIESSNIKVSNGTQIANHTSEALTNIVDGISESADLISEISEASNEQATAITQIMQGLNQIDSVTQQNTARAEETSSTAEELSSQANMLQELIALFKLNQGEESAQISSVKKLSA